MKGGVIIFVRNYKYRYFTFSYYCTFAKTISHYACLQTLSISLLNIFQIDMSTTVNHSPPDYLRVERWLKRHQTLPNLSYVDLVELAAKETKIGNVIQSYDLIQVIQKLMDLNCDLNLLYEEIKHKDPSLQQLEEFTAGHPDFAIWSEELRSLLVILLYR